MQAKPCKVQSMKESKVKVTRNGTHPAPRNNRAGSASKINQGTLRINTPKDHPALETPGEETAGKSPGAESGFPVQKKPLRIDRLWKPREKNRQGEPQEQNLQGEPR